MVVGIGTLLEAAPGTRFMDQPGQPPLWTSFSAARVAELETLRQLAWLVMVAPSTSLDGRGERTGRYRIGGGRGR